MESLHETDRKGLDSVRAAMTRIEDAITAHPLPAVGAAFALGAIVALAMPRIDRGERSVGGMVIAGLGAVAVRVAKSYAIGRLGEVAKSWLLDPRDGSQPSATERAASREPATESFLGH